MKIKIADFLLSAFNKEEYIQFHDGPQSDKDICASFISHGLLNQLSPPELNELLLLHNDETDIWKKRILHRINEIKQVETDSRKNTISIQKAKDFILSKSIRDYKDFYTDLLYKFREIKSCLEDNRDNEKKLFYDTTGKPRNEGFCRDVLTQKLRDRHGLDLIITRENYEGDNRADINIKYKANSSYEVQVECKRDKNKDIMSGIKDQLIDKYLSSQVVYGIYLVFCFSPETDVSKLTSDIQSLIPDQYKQNIDVICIDLR